MKWMISGVLVVLLSGCAYQKGYLEGSYNEDLPKPGGTAIEAQGPESAAPQTSPGSTAESQAARTISPIVNP